MNKFNDLCFDELCVELSNQFYKNSGDNELMKELLVELAERLEIRY